MMLRKSIVLVVAILGVLDGTALAQKQEVVEEMKIVAGDDDPPPSPPKPAPKKPAPKKPSAKKQTPWKRGPDGKIRYEEIPVNADAPKKEETPAPVEEKSSPEGSPKLPDMPNVQLTKPSLLEERPADVAPAEPQPPAKEFVVPPPPAKEAQPDSAKKPDGKKLLEDAFRYYGQGGAGLGWSPKGDKDKTQTALTITYVGMSGKYGFGDHAIAEYRFNAYLGKDDQGSLQTRELFIGMRFPFAPRYYLSKDKDQNGERILKKSWWLDPWIHFGKQDDIGEFPAYLTGDIADVRTLAINNFGRPGWSAIGGVSLAEYAMIRAEFNGQYNFRAVAFDAQYTWFGESWKLQILGNMGYRYANDGLGENSKAVLGVKPSIGPVDLGLVGICEKHTETVSDADGAKGVKGPKVNVCIGQAAVSWMKFTLLYTEGSFIPLTATRGGFRAIHLEYKFEAEEPVQLQIIPFMTLGYAQNVTLFRVPDLVSKSGVNTAYPVFQIGVRGVIGKKDRMWPYPQPQ
jgi:hypothetical protein